MKNSDISELTKPLKSGDILREGDYFWSWDALNDKIEWSEIPKDYLGKEYDPAMMAPMRRPIPQSMEFICSNEKKETDTSPNTLNTTNTTETSR